MGRGKGSHWLHEHHILPETYWHLDMAGFVGLLKASWLFVVLLLLGLMAFITAVLVAWPALSYLGSRLMG